MSQSPSARVRAGPSTPGRTEGEGPGFIPAFLRACEGTEIPYLFAKWSAIAGVSAALGRDVEIPRGHFTLYPNLYIVLVSGSGNRKSTSLSLLHNVILDLPDPLRITAQKQTPEALIEELKNPEARSDGRISFRAEGFGLYDEFVDFMNQRAHEAGLTALLCGLFGCSRRYKYRTRYKGEEVLENVWFGFLGAATVEGLRENLSNDTIGGGLSSRIIFVYSGERPPPVAFPIERADQVADLVPRLARLTSLTGEVTWDPEAREAFQSEYEWAYYEHPFLGDPTLRGYLNRRGDHLAKLATLFAADGRGELTIRPEDVAAAVSTLEEIEVSMPSTLQSVASTARGNETDKVVRILREKGEISHSDLLRRVWRQLDAKGLRGVISTLQDMGKVKVIQEGNRGIRYVWEGGQE